MARIFASVENEKGKREGVGGAEYLDIDIRVGNDRILALTVRRTDELPEGAGWGVYDENDRLIADTPDRQKHKGK